MSWIIMQKHEISLYVPKGGNITFAETRKRTLSLFICRSWVLFFWIFRYLKREEWLSKEMEDQNGIGVSIGSLKDRSSISKVMVQYSESKCTNDKDVGDNNVNNIDNDITSDGDSEDCSDSEENNKNQELVHGDIDWSLPRFLKFVHKELALRKICSFDHGKSVFTLNGMDF